MKQSEEVFVQVGVTALRTPFGEFLPQVPLYIKKEDMDKINKAQGNDWNMDRLVDAFASKHYEEERKQKKGGTKQCQNSKK